MALFSFRHSVKTFSDKRSAEAREAKHGQTAAHLKYITRPQAARAIIRERLSHPTDALIAIVAEREAETRKGRVCERFILALPVEATAEQREALVRAFGEALTKGVAGYVAAIHDQRGNDTANPHAHIAAFDVQVKGGGRGRPRSTIGMARKNAVEETAALWADIHNRMMTGWGYGAESMISHLSFAARGIDRLPEIHEGANQVNREAVGYILVKAASNDVMSVAEQQIAWLLRQRHGLRSAHPDDFRITDPAATMAAQTASTRVLSWLLAAVASVSLVVGGSAS